MKTVRKKSFHCNSFLKYASAYKATRPFVRATSPFLKATRSFLRVTRPFLRVTRPFIKLFIKFVDKYSVRVRLLERQLIRIYFT